jgi:hypothetical protein
VGCRAIKSIKDVRGIGKSRPVGSRAVFSVTSKLETHEHSSFLPYKCIACLVECCMWRVHKISTGLGRV